MSLKKLRHKDILLQISERGSRYLWAKSQESETVHALWQLEIFVKADREENNEWRFSTISCHDLERWKRTVHARGQRLPSPHPRTPLHPVGDHKLWSGMFAHPSRQDTWWCRWLNYVSKALSSLIIHNINVSRIYKYKYWRRHRIELSKCNLAFLG